MGGAEKNVCLSSALFNKHLFEVLNSTVKEFELDEKYQVTLEVTHHGPFIQKPCVFLEIGSTIFEWEDRRAGFVVAKALQKAIETFKENPYNEIAIGIGGPHYCPNFNKLQLNSNVALSHIIPKTIDPITEQMILEAVNKTVEDIDFAVLDWKGLSSQQKKEIIKILEKHYIQYKKVGQVGKLL
jgi:D-aminoacyl-tRNA deacylase